MSNKSGIITNSGEDTWGVALETLQYALKIPPKLSQLMRGCWHGLITLEDFIRLMGSPGISPRCLLRAAHIPQSQENIKATELRAAIETLGLKASAIMLAINCICEKALDSGPPTRVWSPLFKEMMSEIEIGYHVGSGTELVGYEQGILIGFSRVAGLAVLLISHPKEFAEWYPSTLGRGTPKQALEAFGCEPYQISSLLMQQLGLGTEIALATASTLGEDHTSVIEIKPTIHTWRATYHWLHALKAGHDSPSCPISRDHFPEFIVQPGDERVPMHINGLFAQVAEIRKNHSKWTWHLPLPTYEETARALVYRVNSNSCGTTWLRTLETR